MNRRQLIAIQNPCARALETLHDRFYKALAVDGFLMSTILSVNK